MTDILLRHPHLILLLILVMSMGSRTLLRWGSLEMRSRPGRFGRLAVRGHLRFQQAGFRTLVRWSGYLGLPYLALLGGLVTPREMGLIFPTTRAWQHVLLTIGVPLLLPIGALMHLRHLHLIRRPRIMRSWHHPLDLFLVWPEVFLIQTHWAFYRAIALTFVTAPLGAFIGMGLVLLEWGLDPAWWRRSHRLREAWHPLLRMALLGATTGAFVVSGSILPGFMLHLVVETTLLGWWWLSHSQEHTISE